MSPSFFLLPLSLLSLPQCAAAPRRIRARCRRQPRRTARQLLHFGIRVLILEGRARPGGHGRARPGGHVYTTHLGGGQAAVELGGSVITGIHANPLGVLAQQLGIPLHKVRDRCPLYHHDDRTVVMKLNRGMDLVFNTLLEHAEERGVLDWHLANLEFSNAGCLSELSLAPWDQDDHCFLAGRNARCFCTAPLGALKSRSIMLEPELLERKLEAIQRLGFGLLNKVAMVFLPPAEGEEEGERREREEGGRTKETWRTDMWAHISFLPRHRHVERRLGQYRHVGASSAKPLRESNCTGFNSLWVKISGFAVPGSQSELIPIDNDLIALSQTCKNLKSISLWLNPEHYNVGDDIVFRTGFTDGSLKALRMLNSHLRVFARDMGTPRIKILGPPLDPPEIGFTQEGLVSLVQSCPIRVLMLNSALFNDDGMKALSTAQFLETLSLIDCDEVTDHGMRFAVHFPSLINLTLRYCYSVSDVGLSELVHAQKLESLVVGGCPMISEKGVQCAAKSVCYEVECQSLAHYKRLR
uniref:Amine oxidase domain-containing protein n=1 Tax=Oryza barthii TaxID=65489 RepID=A0A0D3FUS6_9ORYZ